jgi:hypothetical protein
MICVILMLCHPYAATFCTWSRCPTSWNATALFGSPERRTGLWVQPPVQDLVVSTLRNSLRLSRMPMVLGP